LDFDEGSPVVGATVELARWPRWEVAGLKAMGEQETAVTQRATTDSGGLFELSLPTAKGHHARIRAPGHLTRFVEPTPGHDSIERAEVVRLVRTTRLRVQLIGPTALPIPGATVVAKGGAPFLAAAGPDVPGDPRWEARTDAEGRCELQDLPHGVALEVRVSLDGEERMRDVVSLRPGETREVVWRLGACRLEGTVVDPHGRPVAKQRVWLVRDTRTEPRYFDAEDEEAARVARADGAGRFAFADLEPGTYRIGPAAERNAGGPPRASAAAPWTESLEILPGESVRVVEVRAILGLYVRGRVLDPDGDPAPETHVVGRPDAGAGAFRTKSADEGRFALGPLLPGGYTLVASPVRASSAPVRAEAGDTDVVLRLAVGESLAGRVVGFAGEPVVGAQVVVVPALRMGPVRATTTGPDGSFRFAGVGPGTYAIVAGADDLRFGLASDVSVAEGSGTEDVLVPLEPGSALRISGPEGASFGGVVWLDETVVAFFVVDPGEPADVTVPARRVRVEAQMGRELETKEVELVPGQRAEVAFGGD